MSRWLDAPWWSIVALRDGPWPRGADRVEGAARAGYVTKSGICGLIGVLAFRQALDMGGSTSGGREAVRTIASGPLGQILLAAVCVGLAGVGAGLISYAFYQALKARYRMID